MFLHSRHQSSAFTAKKPVIYLFSPTRLSDVTVQLILTPSWRFSTIYPSTQSTSGSGKDTTDPQSLTWAVEVEPNGTLKEKTTETEVTFLYWEAE